MRTADPCYLSDVLMTPNLVLSAAPTPLTAAMIAIAMPIAMRAYSIAVAPESSLKKFFNNRRMKKTPVDAAGDSPRAMLQMEP